MAFSTLLLILLSIIVAVALSFYHYLYKANDTSKTTYLLAFLRFLSLFGLLILLINPVLTSSNFETIKTPLVLVVDNSKSIKDLKSDAIAVDVIKKIKSNSSLQNKYDIQTYQFDSEFVSSDTFTFLGKESKINEVGKSLKSTYRNTKFPTLLLSDGNQTSGEDFVYSFDAENKVYPIVLGDTTQYFDLKINQVNVNKYAFYKNKFPVEIFIQSNGNETLNTTFSISDGKKQISAQTLAFSPNKSSQTISVLLPAEKIGVQTYTAKISSNKKEKNTYNNQKKFAVEIIDQRTEVALISSINHPDLGMLKRSIESNSQRKVTIANPLNSNDLEKYNILILYQPTSAFKKVFEQNSQNKINTWIITGTATDFTFLNQHQDQFDFKMTSQKEDYLADFNSNFNLFALENSGFESFPPLENPYGKITPKTEISTLLYSNIRSLNSNMPLFSFYENQGKRGAFLFGSSLWKWRSKSFIETKSFEKFDLFIDKTIQFLSSNDKRKSLIVNHERFYNVGDNIEISAQYFNKNYEFDDNAKLSITLNNLSTKKQKTFDLLKTTNSFKIELDALESGNYSFTVTELNSKSKYSSTFEIIDFDIEKQFANANYAKMKQLAIQTNSQVYFPNQIEKLIDSLQKMDEYKSIEKNVITKKPLIDFKWILVLLSITLALEWFIRKYKGLL